MEKKEIILKGIGASSGIVSSELVLCQHEVLECEEWSLASEDLPAEIDRLKKGLADTAEQLRGVQNDFREKLGKEREGILEAHIMLAEDPIFIGEVVDEIEKTHKNAESVLIGITSQYAETLANMDDPYLRDRANDVKDVSRRILKNLHGVSTNPLREIKKPCVVVTHNLSPADTIGLNKDLVLGLVTDTGSVTSHAAIIARALGIPAVVGVHNITQKTSTGDRILLNGGHGNIVLNPTREREEQYSRLAREQSDIRKELDKLRSEASETRDGYPVALSANIENASEADLIPKCGAKGIGLFRSEFLFLGRATLPDEDEQTKIYKDVAAQLNPDPVVIRTLDVGGDKILESKQSYEEDNPFLGWRAIRLCLDQPWIFKTQLRAILRASATNHNVRIMYPMISCLDELIRANTILEECKTDLRRRGLNFDEKIEVGALIEVPSAALTVDLIAPHVQFLSLGTNDLTQYTLAIDRANDKVSNLYQPAHLAILRLIERVVEQGHKNGLPVAVCGEMAGDPLLVPLLIGLGVDRLSVSPSTVPMIKDVIRAVTYEESHALARKSLKAASGKEVAKLCHNLVKRVASEIITLVE